MATTDTRFKRTPGQNRKPVAVERATQERRPHREKSRARQLAEALANEVLPELPKDPRFHRMWASTTNTAWPIPKLLSNGYTLVTAQQAPDLAYLLKKDGDHKGALLVNEMIALQCDIEVYAELMELWHHEAPNDAEEGIAAAVQARLDDHNEAAGEKARNIIGSGTQEILGGRHRPAPDFRDDA